MFIYLMVRVRRSASTRKSWLIERCTCLYFGLCYALNQVSMDETNAYVRSLVWFGLCGALNQVSMDETNAYGVWCDFMNVVIPCLFVVGADTETRDTFNVFWFFHSWVCIYGVLVLVLLLCSLGSTSMDEISYARLLFINHERRGHFVFPPNSLRY